MSSAPRRVLTVLRPLGGLLLLLLLLLGLSAPAVRGDCGLPYDIPNSQPDLRGQTSFPQNTTVTFKCNQGFVKVPGRPDSVICLANDQWSQIAEFCNRSCTVPPRLRFASLKKEYNKQNYFPVGTVVEYECRPGYRRNGFLLGKITCRSDLEWSKPDEFCKKKSCTNPGDIRNGNVNITTDLLFGSLITFSCDTGYKLVGATSSYCIIVGSGVGWSDPLPECTEIYCPEPPTIENGIIQEEHETYAYGQSITYTCNKGFTLVGKSSIYCTVKDNQGEWSDPPPECRGKPTVPKVPTTVVPVTHDVPTAKTTRKSHAASTPNGKGHSSGTKSLIYGKSGSWAIKRNCHHCGMYSPYSWKRILSFNCLRKTIKMQCLQVPKRKWVNAFYQHVLWTPLGTRYVPVYSQPCSCSKVILGQLQVTWPISQVVLRAYCINPSF